MSTTDTTTQPTARLVKMTPEWARNLLEKNVRNRSIRPHVVTKYAEDMIAGRWQFAADPIRVSRTGVLLDGQHRLATISRLDFDVQVLLVEGLEDETQKVMDIGAQRSVGDQLALAGYKYTSSLSATGLLHLGFKTARLKDNRRATISKPEVFDHIQANEDVMVYWATYAQTHRGFGTSIAALGAACVAIEQAGWSREVVTAWLQSMLDMQTTGAGDPRLALMQRFAAAARTREHISAEVQMGIYIRVWHACVQDRPLNRVLVVSRGDTISVPQVLRAPESGRPKSTRFIPSTTDGQEA